MRKTALWGKGFSSISYSFMTGQETETGLALEQNQLQSHCPQSTTGRAAELECSDPASLLSIKCEMSRDTDAV